MRGGPGRGAVVGLTVGVALVGLLVWLPAAVSGDYYEFTDPLVFMGIPIVVASVALGTLIGTLATRVWGNGLTDGDRRPSGLGTAAVVASAVGALLLATAFFLMAIRGV